MRGAGHEDPDKALERTQSESARIRNCTGGARQPARRAARLEHSRSSQKPDGAGRPAAGRDDLRRGRRADRFYVLLNSVVSLSQTGFGNRVLRPGDTFGEVSLALRIPRAGTARTVTPVTVASCDAATFDEFLRPLFAEDHAGSRRALRPRAAAKRSLPSHELQVGEARAGDANLRIDPEKRAARAEVAERLRRVARARPVRRLGVAQLEREPQSFGSWRPKPGSTPRSPGNCTLVASASVSARRAWARAARARARRVVERSAVTPGGRGDELAAERERLPHRRVKVLERQLRRGGDELRGDLDPRVGVDPATCRRRDQRAVVERETRCVQRASVEASSRAARPDRRGRRGPPRRRRDR